MFKNYFKTAFRSLMKNKATSIINILGLSIGISAALIIFLIIQHEYSFDKWEPNGERIYRVYTQWGELGTNSGISVLAPKAITDKVTSIDAVAHYIDEAMDDATIEIARNGKGQRKIVNSAKGTIFADDQYFQIFPMKWLAGNPKSLNELNHVVLSESKAKYFFPNVPTNNIIGRQLVFNDSINTVITGIVADVKQTTDFDNKIFISLKTVTETNLQKSLIGTPDWTNVSYASQCLVLLHPNANPTQVNKQIQQLFKDNIHNDNPKDIVPYGRLQALQDIHLNPQVTPGNGAQKNLRNIALLAVVLTLLAVINFVNLTTAQSTLRAKEVGVRKTFGGNKQQIIQQFLIETFLLICGATLLAFALYPVLFQAFRKFIPETMTLDVIWQPLTAIYIVSLIVILTLLSGIYPAFVMSKYQPIQALKGNTNKTGKPEKIWLRQSLIVLQFVVAQCFLIIVFVIGKQIQYVLNKDMGFKKDAIVSFYTPDYALGKRSQISVLAQTMRSIPGIANVSQSSGTPALIGWHSTKLTVKNGKEKKDIDAVHVRNIDDNYLSLFGLKLIAGSNVKIDTSTTVPDILINETLMKQMGFASSKAAIGALVRGGNADTSRISGVVKDFNTMSLANPIQPTVLFANDFGYAYTISFALSSSNPKDWTKTLNDVQRAFQKAYPEKIFAYTFFDKTIESMYSQQIRLNTLLTWATGLSIFISCMGLIGLVMFMANQRTKEIGIRKVLGASIPQILGLLSRNLIGLIVLASVIAFPIAWYFSHEWLQDFAYKTKLSWWIFPVCAVGMSIVALVILWSWSLKAAKANPATVLRTE
ncbi:MAG: ABC transporter permease [Chitinophagaceae bacterium]